MTTQRFDLRPRELGGILTTALTLLAIAYLMGRLDGTLSARRDALVLRPTIDGAVAVAEQYDGDGVLMDVHPISVADPDLREELADRMHPGSQPLSVCTSPAGQEYYSDRPCPKDWR